MRKSKLLLNVLLSFAFLAFVFMYTGKAVQASTTFIAGKVTNASLAEVDGASVVAVCHHSDGDHTMTTSSDVHGNYAVGFPDTQCSPSETATVTATKGSASGSNSGVVSHFSIIDIAIVNVAIPELGMITGAVALMASAGYIFSLKRRTV